MNARMERRGAVVGREIGGLAGWLAKVKNSRLVGVFGSGSDEIDATPLGFLMIAE
jgi:hypothetical protein